MDSTGFHNIAQSLKQYRRADLKEFSGQIGDNPIDAVYVDPLPKNAILNTVLAPTTTFLLGRKGTGKSTVFARAQSELRARADVISTYIDVKALAELLDAGDHSTIPEGAGLSPELIGEHLLKKGFLAQILKELVEEIDAVCEKEAFGKNLQVKAARHFLSSRD